MALAFPHLRFLYELRKAGIFPSKVNLMEFGEQNWYGDVPAGAIMETAREFTPDAAASLEQELLTLLDGFETADAVTKNRVLFKLAETYYRTLFTMERYDAVDLHGTERAQRYDLNEPLPIKDTYDLVINFGTGEHVFNQYEFFRNMHNVTAVNGLMLHSMPNQGCYDHGFYNYHPTFVFDLAMANNYGVHAMIYADLTKKPAELHMLNQVDYVQMAVNKQLSNYSALLVCFRKQNDAPFVTPQQGYYSNNLPPELRTAWEAMER